VWEYSLGRQARSSSRYKGHPTTGLDICTGKRSFQTIRYAAVEEVGEEIIIIIIIIIICC
jgi:hypothetical protein